MVPSFGHDDVVVAMPVLVRMWKQFPTTESSRVESSLYAKKMAGPIGHRREKEMKREQIAKYIHEI